MKSIIFTFFSILLATHSFAANDCADLSDDCAYYSCIEKERVCGKRGYPLAFGQKYCNKFDSRVEKFSEDGRKWIQDVKACLISGMNDISSESSCKEFKKTAISHHVPCYLSAGYCELSKEDKKQVIKIVRASAWRLDIILAGYQVISSCLND
ncbi:hypothetical protein [Halobacteriovorax sp. CON-3]|uniref:hypothetical protein n=1 Tax=Halobacteriovorax sp. CON-3 TaxID=3157710 RepID=UPI0037137697